MVCCAGALFQITLFESCVYMSDYVKIIYGMASAHVQHMQKALTMMNIRLHEVISQIQGSSGVKISEAFFQENEMLKNWPCFAIGKSLKIKKEML